MNEKELIGKIHSSMYHQLQVRGYAAPVDVLIDTGILPKQKYEDWRFGRVRQEQERSGQTLSEYVEQLIQNYYDMKENTKMTGDMRTMAIQLPEELFERLKAYLKKNNLKQKQFIIGLIEDALEQEEEDTAEQPETEESDEPDMDAEEE